jgi:hypothetical protein
VKLLRFFPKEMHTYEGYQAWFYIYGLLAAVSTLRSLLHLFLPDGGSTSIAGIAVGADAAGVVTFLFAWVGLYQLIWAAVQWLILLKLRGLLPLLALLVFLEQLGMFLLPYFKPGMSASLLHTPPEAIANKALVPITAILLLAVLIKPERGVKG